MIHKYLSLHFFWEDIHKFPSCTDIILEYFEIILSVKIQLNLEYNVKYDSCKAC